jgi:hypothetical protein
MYQCSLAMLGPDPRTDYAVRASLCSFGRGARELVLFRRQEHRGLPNKNAGWC